MQGAVIQRWTALAGLYDEARLHLFLAQVMGRLVALSPMGVLVDLDGLQCRGVASPLRTDDVVAREELPKDKLLSLVARPRDVALSRLAVATVFLR